MTKTAQTEVGHPMSRVFLDVGTGREPIRLKKVMAFAICPSPDLFLASVQAWTGRPLCPSLSPHSLHSPLLCGISPPNPHF